MAKLQYGLNEELLKNMIIARKNEIRVKIKCTTVKKEKPMVQEDDCEIEM